MCFKNGHFFLNSSSVEHHGYKVYMYTHMYYKEQVVLTDGVGHSKDGTRADPLSIGRMTSC